MLDLEKYMGRCIELARLGEYYVAPNPMVGAMLVDASGTIISEGWHHCYGGAHAEVDCLADLRSEQVAGQDNSLFVTLEPCSHYGKTPPCADMVVARSKELGIKRVVIGSLDPNPLVSGKGLKRLTEAGLEVITGIKEDECKRLNRRFFCLHEKHRPYVILKWAQTADGILGSSTGRVVISNSLTKRIVHKMRAENMAIMVGSNTALIDNPRLLNTHWAGRNPIRILLDRRGQVPKDYRIFSVDAETIVYSNNTDWEFVLHDLADRKIHSVLVEGGATILNYILSTGIFDEVHIEVNPLLRLGKGIAAPLLPNTFGSIFEEKRIADNILYTYEKK